MLLFFALSCAAVAWLLLFSYKDWGKASATLTHRQANCRCPVLLLLVLLLSVLLLFALLFGGSIAFVLGLSRATLSVFIGMALCSCFAVANSNGFGVLFTLFLMSE